MAVKSWNKGAEYQDLPPAGRHSVQTSGLRYTGGEGEGGKERGREGGREGEREGRKERGREGRRKGGR